MAVKGGYRRTRKEITKIEWARKPNPLPPAPERATTQPHASKRCSNGAGGIHSPQPFSFSNLCNLPADRASKPLAEPSNPETPPPAHVQRATRAPRR
jgi:hypothetical protein